MSEAKDQYGMDRPSKQSINDFKGLVTLATEVSPERRKALDASRTLTVSEGGHAMIKEYVYDEGNNHSEVVTSYMLDADKDGKPAIFKEVYTINPKHDRDFHVDAAASPEDVASYDLATDLFRNMADRLPEFIAKADVHIDGITDEIIESLELERDLGIDRQASGTEVQELNDLIRTTFFPDQI